MYLGIDLGGTNIKLGVVDDQGRPLARLSIPTDAGKGPIDGVRRMGVAAREVIDQAGLTLKDLTAVGIGSPGTMNLKEQIVLDPHNLPGWSNLRLGDLITADLGLPTVLQNDANAAAFGEFWAGAGRGCSSMVQFTLGTGVGCGIIIRGQLLEGEHSHGAEGGHQRIALDNPRRNGTGLFGSLEAYACAPAVVARTQEAIAAGAASILKGQDFDCEGVFHAADQGDGLAQRIVDQTAFYLAIGAVNLMHIIDPDLVVFSGGMIAAGQSFLASIRKYVKQNALPIPGAATRIEFAQLGADAGWIGAAGCARVRFAISPSSLTSITARAPSPISSC